MSHANITLIGMPGSGKSYIGRKLAAKLGYKIVDLDAVLEHEYNLSLQQILENLGQDAFLKKQADDAISNTKDREGLVISPGGSIVYTNNAMQHLKRISTIVYLRTSLEVIMTRIGKIPRGIVGLKSKTMEDLYAERTMLYQ
jgi:shikimate kinase